jgi:hypothetical protein
LRSQRSGDGLWGRTRRVVRWCLFRIGAWCACPLALAITAAYRRQTSCRVSPNQARLSESNQFHQEQNEATWRMKHSREHFYTFGADVKMPPAAPRIAGASSSRLCLFCVLVVCCGKQDKLGSFRHTFTSLLEHPESTALGTPSTLDPPPCTRRHHKYQQGPPISRPGHCVSKLVQS